MFKMLSLWLGWFRAFLMDTSQAVEYSKNWKLFHISTCQNWRKMENRQSYQKPSIILPRVIPTILMRSWDMLDWLGAFLADTDYHGTSQVVQYSKNWQLFHVTCQIWRKIENQQSYQKASIFLSRVIPNILMRSWDMLGWLGACLVDN